MSAENPDQEVQSQVKHSPEVGQTGENEYAKLAKGAPHASEMTDSQAERANMWAEAGERADERLQTARQNLAEVESGQIPEGKSKYEAWEEAMSNVETEKARASDMAERRHNVMNVPEVQPVMSAEEAEAAAQSDHAQLERAVGAAIVRGATEGRITPETQA